MQKMQPMPTDPMQAKVMKLMPIMFTVFFMFFPAGLVLYWTVNNLLSMLQQWVVNMQLATSKKS
jgi:YidC/Oxa1 family membrane protein insertase